MFDFLLGKKEVDKGVYRISGMFVYRYLFTGAKQSVLMDTGYGIGNIKKKVNKISSAPVTVCNSHYHPDHSDGNVQFDTVYVNEHDVPFTEPKLSIDQLTDRLLTAMVEKHSWVKIIRPLLKRVLVTREGDTKYIGVPDDYKFDLGDRELVLHWVPGHTEGSCVMLDKDRHIIYTGDSCNTSTWLFTDFGVSMAEYADNLDKFYDSIKNDGYEKLICSHAPIPNRVDFITDYAAWVRGIKKTDKCKKFHIPGFENDALCIKMKFSLKHKGPMSVFYFESQAAE